MSRILEGASWLRLPLFMLITVANCVPAGTGTFLQNRVNLPHSMYGKGYYVVGTFQGSTNFGQVTKCDRTGEFCRVVSRMVLSSRGSSDVYLAHYSQDNKPQWAIKAGGDGEDKGRALAVDSADGNIVIFGYFSGVARFGHLTLMSTRPRLDCAHGCAAFVAKFLKDGRALWVQEVGQPTYKGAQDVDTTASVLYWSARATEFLLANPEPEFNLDFWSDERTATTIIKNPEDLEKYV
eukprot:TRINITY_DN3729_c0_g1_i2.p1 TRINITY_DN3729_c0_g1~~TRINITY_DN3729_c0_g1_i2.p1  ORF type:complete len:237 (+),score=23.31 TRINITY_DN3729_c0_g1_i2:226-936(+)